MDPTGHPGRAGGRAAGRATPRRRGRSTTRADDGRVRTAERSHARSTRRRPTDDRDDRYVGPRLPVPDRDAADEPDVHDGRANWTTVQRLDQRRRPRRPVRSRRPLAAGRRLLESDRARRVSAADAATSTARAGGPTTDATAGRPPDDDQPTPTGHRIDQLRIRPHLAGRRSPRRPAGRRPRRRPPADCPTRLLPALRDAVFGRRLTPIGTPNRSCCSARSRAAAGRAGAGLRRRRPDPAGQPGAAAAGRPGPRRLRRRRRRRCPGCSSPSWCSAPTTTPGCCARTAAGSGCGWSAGSCRRAGSPAALLVELGAAGEPAAARQLRRRPLDRRAGAAAAGRAVELRAGQRPAAPHRHPRTSCTARSGSTRTRRSRASEREQVACCARACATATGPRQHHVQVPLPGAGTLSCRAEVEFARRTAPRCGSSGWSAT